MIAKLEKTPSTTQQNKDLTQNPLMGATINNEPTTTEPLPENGQQLKPPRGGLKLILLAKTSVLLLSKHFLARVDAYQRSGVTGIASKFCTTMYVEL